MYKSRRFVGYVSNKVTRYLQNQKKLAFSILYRIELLSGHDIWF